MIRSRAKFRRLPVAGCAIVANTVPLSVRYVALLMIATGGGGESGSPCFEVGWNYLPHFRASMRRSKSAKFEIVLRFVFCTGLYHIVLSSKRTPIIHVHVHVHVHAAMGTCT